MLILSEKLVIRCISYLLFLQCRKYRSNAKIGSDFSRAIGRVRNIRVFLRSDRNNSCFLRYTFLVCKGRSLLERGKLR